MVRKMFGGPVPNPNLLLCFWIITTTPALAFGENVVAKVGGAVVLHCFNESETVEWYRPDGQKIKSDGEKYVIDVANNTLTVSKTGELDIGDYHCQTTFRNKTFHVLSAPYIKPLEKSVNLIQGDKLKLICSAWGNPIPSVVWIKSVEKESLEINVNDHVYTSREGSLENAILNVTAVTYDDYGLYTCNATNTYGSVKATTKIRVKDKLAPLWPFIGICAEVIVLVIIIIIYEKQKLKQNNDEDTKEEGGTQNNSNDHQDKEKVRLRK